MITNDLKKGDVVWLANGWKAEVMDNRKGNIRLCKVYGLYTEIGSVYAHDMISVEKNGTREPLEHTAKQVTVRNRVKSLGL